MIITEDRGFTLIEIVISLTLLLILVPAFSTALVGSLQNEEQMNQQFDARRVTNSIIENLKRDRYRNEFDNPDISWTDNRNEFENFKINFKNNADQSTDIIIIIEEADFNDNLYLIRIEWQNLNYSVEILILGE